MHTQSARVVYLSSFYVSPFTANPQVLYQLRLVSRARDWGPPEVPVIVFMPNISFNLVGREFRILWLHLCREVRPLHPQWVSWYDTKPSDGETSVLEPWEMWRNPSLPLLPCSPWPRVIVSDRVPSMGQIELFHHLTVCKQIDDC